MIANYELKLKLPSEFEDSVWNMFVDEFKVLILIGVRKSSFKDIVENTNVQIKLKNELLEEIF